MGMVKFDTGMVIVDTESTVWFAQGHLDGSHHHGHHRDRKPRSPKPESDNQHLNPESRNPKATATVTTQIVKPVPLASRLPFRICIASTQRALPAETNFESGTSQSESGTSVNSSNSGDP